MKKRLRGLLTGRAISVTVVKNIMFAISTTAFYNVIANKIIRKKLVPAILSIVLFCSVFPFNVSANTYGIYGDLKYERVPFNVYIVSCDRSASGTVIIPNEIDGVPVTGIGNGAFSNCSNITNISIPNSVHSIGNSAFDGCTALTTITIPNGVYSISDWMFYGCTSLIDVSIPSSVSSIGIYAFSDCTSLTNISLPDSLNDIGLQAFNGTGYYNDSRNWSNGVLYIGNHLIAAQKSIVKCEVKPGTKSISAYAFSECTELTSISIPSSVWLINKYAFESCRSLSHISISGEETRIKANAFYTTAYYNNHQNWENGILYIGSHLIAAQESITSCKIKSGTTTVQEYAFNNCTKLASVYIPESLALINTGAFCNCFNLNDIYIPSIAWEWSCMVVYDNDNLAYFNATPHYICPTYTFCEKQDSTYHVNIRCIQELTDEFFAVVLYDKNGNLIYFKQIPCDGKKDYETSLPVIGNAGFLKVFVWDNTGAMSPVGATETISL